MKLLKLPLTILVLALVLAFAHVVGSLPVAQASHVWFPSPCHNVWVKPGHWSGDLWEYRLTNQPGQPYIKVPILNSPQWGIADFFRAQGEGVGQSEFYECGSLGYPTSSLIEIRGRELYVDHTAYGLYHEENFYSGNNRHLGWAQRFSCGMVVQYNREGRMNSQVLSDQDGRQIFMEPFYSNHWRRGVWAWFGDYNSPHTCPQEGPNLWIPFDPRFP